MQTKTQMQWIKEQLEINGHITRNQCLQIYISRLAACIADLREAGWDIQGTRMSNGNFKYTLVK